MRWARWHLWAVATDMTWAKGLDSVGGGMLLCGNFNMTNVDEIFSRIEASGQHPRIYSDTVMLLEQLGYALDKENHRIYRDFRDTMGGAELAAAIEDNLVSTGTPQGWEKS